MDIRDVREALWRAYRVALDNGLDGWKSSEAYCDVKYPAYFTSEDEAEFFQPYELEVYSYALGPSRSHYFRRAATESQPNYYTWCGPDIFALAVRVIGEWERKFVREQEAK